LVASGAKGPKKLHWKPLINRKGARWLSLQATPSAERIAGGYDVKDATGQALAYVYARELQGPHR